MKKVLIGCGIVVLLFIAIAVGVATYAGVKLAKLGNSMEAAGASVVQLNKDFAFQIPDAGATMDSARFQAYLDLRDRLVARARQIPLVAKIASIQPGVPPPDIAMGDIFGTIGEIPKLVQFYADELRAAGMSTDEYAWMSMETLKAIHTAAENGDAEYALVWQKIEEAADAAETAINNSNNRDPNVQAAMQVFRSELKSAMESTAPEGNVQLVVGAKERLTKDPMVLIIELMVTVMLNQTMSPSP